MTQKHWFSRCLQLRCIGILGWLGVSVFASKTLAQSVPSNIVPDKTLGSESSVVTPNSQELAREEITGGATRGTNLFHSFQEFNVSARRGAYFFSPDAGIQNILARVTGSNPSEILGTLGTFGKSAPNLFLINPNGIVFGDNASLDVKGSFVATTANAVKLGETGLFSATEPANSNLLTVTPSALFFNALASQEIINRSRATRTMLGSSTTGLKVPDGQSLLLVGGNVKLEGGILQAPGGRVELGGLVEPGTVDLNKDGNNLSLSFPDGVVRGDVSLTNGADVYVRAGNGGSIAVNARSLEMKGGVDVGLRAGIADGLGNANSKAGNIDINAQGTVNLQNGGVVSNVVRPTATGQAGDIRIKTDSLSVGNGFQIVSRTQGQGNAGNVIINTQSVSFDGKDKDGIPSGISSTVTPSAIGKGGNIRITTDSFSITNGAILSANTSGQGDAGNLMIDARDTVLFNSSSARTSVEKDAVGKGGNISIVTRSLSVNNNAQLIATASGKGNAGNVIINARDSVSFNSGNAFSTLGQGAVGKGGDISITANSLSVTNGAGLTASTNGQGDAGNVIINARDTVSFNGGNAFSALQQGAVGKGGDISITANSLSVTNGAQLQALSKGQGDAGNVIINARDSISFNRGNAFSTLEQGAVGKGGDISITANSLSVTNGAGLTASTNGQGDAGNVIINARDTVSFNRGNAFSTLEQGAVGKGGDISITANSLSVTNGAGLIASTNGQGDAGNVIINARDTISFDGISSDGMFRTATLSSVGQTGVGNGGDIRITTSSLSVTNGAQLSTSTNGQGDAGNVIINAKELVTFDSTGAAFLFGRTNAALSSVEQTGVGNGGDIRISTGSLSVIGSRLSASTNGKGDAGSIIIDARDRVFLNGGEVSSDVGLRAIGNGGDIRITTGSLSVTKVAQLDARTFGKGDAGSIIIDARDVSFNRSDATSNVGLNAVGKGGDIRITTNVFSLTNSSELSTGSSGKGDAGNLIIDAKETVSFDNSNVSSTVRFNAVGKGGDIRIATSSFVVLNNTYIRADSFGDGDAGNLTINARDFVSLDSSFIFSDLGERRSRGKGGDIRITTGSLSVTNEAQLVAGTSGEGNAGNVIIDAKERVSFNGRSAAFSSVERTGVGKGGDIRITTGSLFVTNEAQLLAYTSGQGNAGNLIINATDEVSFDGKGGAFSNVAPRGRGKGGDIRISTHVFSATNGAQLLADTREQGQGDAGSIQINATDSITVSGTSSDGFSSGFLTSTRTTSAGKGGDIIVDTPALYISNGAVLDARTTNNRNGGNITINVRRAEIINGGQILSISSSSGNAGKITLNATDQVIVNGSDRIFNDRVARFGIAVAPINPNSGLFVLSQGSGIAGNIEVTSPQIRLDSTGTINATSASGNGGNINLQASNLLLLRRGSQVSATAGTARQGGDGGNIDINSKFIVAVPQENSDLSANAYTGSGGNVQITLKGSSVSNLAQSQVIKVTLPRVRN